MVESFDHHRSALTFRWSGDSADEAVAQFITAMDSASSDGAATLPYSRDTALRQAFAEFLAGQTRSSRVVGQHTITLTRTAKP